MKGARSRAWRGQSQALEVLPSLNAQLILVHPAHDQEIQDSKEIKRGPGSLERELQLLEKVNGKRA